MYNSFCNERLSLFLTRKLQDQQLHVHADDQHQLEFSDIDALSDEGSVFVFVCVCVHVCVWVWYLWSYFTLNTVLQLIANTYRYSMLGCVRERGLS